MGEQRLESCGAVLSYRSLARAASPGYKAQGGLFVLPEGRAFAERLNDMVLGSREARQTHTDAHVSILCCPRRRPLWGGTTTWCTAPQRTSWTTARQRRSEWLCLWTGVMLLTCWLVDSMWLAIWYEHALARRCWSTVRYSGHRSHALPLAAVCSSFYAVSQ